MPKKTIKHKKELTRKAIAGWLGLFGIVLTLLAQVVSIKGSLERQEKANKYNWGNNYTNSIPADFQGWPEKK